MSLKYTDQDIRAEVIKVRDELIANLKFLMECIEEDRHTMEGYRSRFKDIRYRPILSTDATGYITYGLPTDLVIEPLASKMRASINSLLQSIRLIQSEILPEDNPEGASQPIEGEAAVSTKRASFRDSFAKDAQHSKLPPQPIEDALEEAEAEIPPTKLVEKRKTSTILPIKPVAKPEQVTEPVSKPWRTQGQSKFVPKSEAIEPIAQPQPIVVEAPKTLTNPDKLDPESERIKAELMGLKSNRMAAIAQKYRK